MRHKLFLTVAVLLAVTGCITVNVPLGNTDQLPAYQWILKWDAPASSQRAGSFTNSLRVRDFDAVGSYQLSGMVVTHADGTVHESSDNRWAVRPGAMLSEMLSRDLIAAGGFPGVFRTATSVTDVLTLEGYVREFGARQVDSTTWVAVFDVDVTLLGNRGIDVLFQKNYKYQRRMPAPGFRELTDQLSALSSTWSDAVRNDIYSAISN